MGKNIKMLLSTHTFRGKIYWIVRKGLRKIYHAEYKLNNIYSYTELHSFRKPFSINSFEC